MMKWCHDVSMQAEDLLLHVGISRLHDNWTSSVQIWIKLQYYNGSENTHYLLQYGFTISVATCNLSRISQLPSHSNVIGLFCTTVLRPQRVWEHEVRADQDQLSGSHCSVRKNKWKHPNSFIYKRLTEINSTFHEETILRILTDYWNDRIMW